MHQMLSADSIKGGCMSIIEYKQNEILLVNVYILIAFTGTFFSFFFGLVFFPPNRTVIPRLQSLFTNISDWFAGIGSWF